ncbi:hypothetical protein KCMEEFEO_00064 [Pseudomonas phage MD8]|uniref:hypothetical protein n=1 Tax=Pseudomonas phage MD8 TaxID=1868596 RepID=UPI0004494D37|nr:hypothetical protein [Pseudomonas aeruginosa]YP_009289292.1 hypothetical protein BI094_gp64 [Pseudomonas phage MD8]EZO24353.1 hypothetical protein AJ62_03345 [Pseudomonas aeruginosa 3575]ANO57366.1 hypothetical protein KCMEEFEO_00064 [Pseudomonas phage MD8]MBX6153269.1 hypothetical protein [Pseudomonas aeruginosa]MBX6176160.1 hypothetical protein [Pseudomonas aeruginosa]MCV6291784.1 hypothetical protein [Pseudomonas aeruginosa]
MTFRIVARQRWWLKLYLAGVSITSVITGLEPDPMRVSYWIRRGIKINVVPGE